jgi:hypothetical protein
MTKELQLCGLKARNFMGLRAVDLAFDGTGVTIVSGANEQGKSALIRSIWAAVGGAKKTPDDPIREGETEASVEVKVCDVLPDGSQGDVRFVVERRWWIKGAGGLATKLVVTDATGAARSSPQNLLRALVTTVSIDPFAFDDLCKLGAEGRRKQRDILLGLVTLEIPDQADSIAAQHDLGPTADGDPLATIDGWKVVLSDRRKAARDARDRITADLEQLADAEPVERVDVAAVMEEAAAARSRHAEIKDLARDLADKERELEVLLERVEAVKAEVEQLARARDEHGSPEEAAARVEELDRKIATAAERNEAATWHDKRIETEGMLAPAEERFAALDAAFKSMESAKAAMLAAAALPIPELGFDEAGVTYNGRPMDQASSEERMWTSLQIAVATNPTLRLVSVEDGNRLDYLNQRRVDEFMRENGYLCLMELVDTTGKVGLVIDDGEVAADNRAEKVLA